jgi:diguanylate cyclase (GGDEF)-like protein
MRARVLVLEKDEKVAEEIRSYLVSRNHQVDTLDPDKLTAEIHSSPAYDAVIFAEDSCSLSLVQLRRILDLDNMSTFLVLLGADPELDRVVDIMVDGAHAYLTKPVNCRRLRGVLEKGLENKGILKDIMQMAAQVQESNRQLQKHKRTLLREKQQLERRTRQLGFLHELSLAINGSLDRHQIVEQVFAKLQDELQVNWCRARLFSGENGEPAWEYAVGVSKKADEKEFFSLEAGGKAVGTMEVALPTQVGEEYRQLFDTIALQVALALQNASHHAEVKRLADRDALTRLKNRRSFERQLQREFEIHRRYREDLSLIFWDLDHFKEINDLLGHQTGDEVLRQVGHLMQEALRNCDYVARWGGDEFAAILPRTTKEQAFHSAERLRCRLQQQRLDLGHDFRLSASFGIADTKSLRLGVQEELIAMADQALYQAKRAGRNRIELFEEYEHLSCQPLRMQRASCPEIAV